MEIGKIKWAGHYNSQTGDFNNYGFITRLVNYEDLYFRKEGVRTGSRLLTMFNDSDDKYVVFDVVPSPRKASQLQADKVCFLEEIKPEEVVKNLSAEGLASQEVQRILLEKCPDALLGDDPIAYFPLMHSAKVRKAFADRYDSGRFKQNVISALSIYFKQTNIRFMDKKKYSFIIMVKGMRSLVKELVLEVRSTFEDNREFTIRSHRVNGITVQRKLFPSDEKERFFHIYYNDGKKAGERERLEAKIDQMATVLRKCERKKLPNLNRTYNKYFNMVYMNQGKKDEKFMYAEEKKDVISQDIHLCGYFILVTSEKMTAEEALDLYRSRDVSEKLFRGDKSYLGNSTIRNYTTEPRHAKIFLEFVALIIRNRFFTYLKEYMKMTDKRRNYYTVPAAIKELDKIEIIQQADRNYRLNHAVTAKQKDILKAFNMTAANIKEEAIAINDQLIQITARRLQHGTQNNNN